MPKRSANSSKHGQEQINEYMIGKKKAIVTPKYKDSGENICEILLKLMIKDEEDSATA